MMTQALQLAKKPHIVIGNHITYTNLLTAKQYSTNGLRQD